MIGALNSLAIVWCLFVVVGWIVMIAVLGRRRRSRYARWLAVLALFGPILTWPATDLKAYGGFGLIVAGSGLVMFLVSLIGLRPARLPKDRCWACGYDFRGDREDSSTRCPECGEGRVGLEGHCLECRGDLRQAIAGGSIICPHCRAPIPPSAYDD